MFSVKFYGKWLGNLVYIGRNLKVRGTIQISVWFYAVAANSIIPKCRCQFSKSSSRLFTLV